MIYVLSPKNAASLGSAFGRGGGAPWVKIFPHGLTSLKIREFPEIQDEDQVYLDISGLSPREAAKAAGFLKKHWAFWGIIDPGGGTDDPASFFFKGASDYIGAALVKKGLGKKRFESAAAAKRARGADAAGNGPGEDKPLKKAVRRKLPDEEFKGWKYVTPGAASPFFFLYAHLGGKLPSGSTMGEDILNAVKDRLRDTLQQNLRYADALLWIETGNRYLFLVPARAANGRAAVEAALKMLADSRITVIEKLGLSIPAEFTFALHYGSTVFRPPGETGSLISEPVNYIFHLGIKKAGAGRLTVSGDVGGEAVPDGLSDLFTPAGVFEGIPIRHSRRFVHLR